MRLLSLMLLVLYLPACTRQVTRKPVEVRHFAVDWDAVHAPTLSMDGLEVQGLVLIPSRWPLEGSVKRLLRGDFVGMIDAFDLSFQSGKVPDGALDQLYDAGYLSAYVRVRNTDTEPRPFWPERLVVELDGEGALLSVPPQDLPTRFKEIDWMATGMTVLAAALFVAIVAAGHEGRLDEGLTDTLTRVPAQIIVETSGHRESEDDAPARSVAAAHEAEPGILWGQVVPPGQSREGFVFFSIPSGMTDWSRAKLAVW